jgi:hypothetical protein
MHMHMAMANDQDGHLKLAVCICIINIIYRCTINAQRRPKIMPVPVSGIRRRALLLVYGIDMDSRWRIATAIDISIDRRSQISYLYLCL